MAKRTKKKSAHANRESGEKLSLRELVSEIRPANRYHETLTGPEVGKEIVEWIGELPAANQK